MIFLGLGTSSLFAAGLSFLVLLTFIAGLIKVALNKRDLKKKIKLANLEAANKQTDREKLVGQRDLDEGDLFGVRAIQAGFYGGVTQSCPNSPVPSRTSSVASQDAISTASSSRNPSSLLLEPPRHGSYKLPSSRKSSTSSQNSLSCTDGISSINSDSSNYQTSSSKVNTNWEQISVNGQRIDLLGLKINKNPENSALIVPASPEPALKSASASIVSFEDSISSSRHPIYSHDEGSSRSHIPFINAGVPNSRPPLNRASSKSTESVLRRDALSDLSTLSSNLPSQISPTALIRDSIVSKQQVSISQANINTRHMPIDKRKYSDATSNFSARTSEIESVLDYSLDNNVSPLKINQHFQSHENNHRPRTSQSSIDDFYDVYYRQTLMRQSVL